VISHKLFREKERGKGKMKFAEYMETFGVVRNGFQPLSNSTMHIKRGKNGVKREKRLLKERTFKIEAKRYPIASENIEVLKSLLK
jgi:hypothetical protein